VAVDAQTGRVFASNLPYMGPGTLARPRLATAEFAVLGFVVVGPLNAVANARAVARDLGGNVVLFKLLARPPPTGRPCSGVYGGSHWRLISPWPNGSQ
jgi:hypothetical protein